MLMCGCVDLHSHFRSFILCAELSNLARLLTCESCIKSMTYVTALCNCNKKGNWGVQHELRAGYEVRGVWPKNGVYTKGGGGAVGGASVAELATDSAISDNPAANLILITPKRDRWCKPWEQSDWPTCKGEPPASTVPSI